MTKRSKGRATTIVAESPTFIELILDETGSMGSYRNQAIGGFNDFLKEQQAQPGECALTLTKFHTGRTRTPYVDLDIQIVPKLNTKTYAPGGGTNLYDTIASRIAQLDERLAAIDGPANVVVIVMTDGQDTSSVLNAGHIAELIAQRMQRGWTFVYLGAFHGAEQAGLNMGFPKGNIRSFAAAVMEETMHQTAMATTAYRAARASGEIATGTTSTTYFTE